MARPHARNRESSMGGDITDMLIAKPLIKLDKERKITIKNGADGKVYLMITPKRYIGSGIGINEAIDDANMRTFATGYRVERV